MALGEGRSFASLIPPGLIALGVVALDQAAKILVDVTLSAGATVPLIGNHLQLVYVRNSGAAFGLLRDSGVPFVLVSIAASVLVLLYLLLISPRRVLGRRALALILGGAVGNMTDRILRSGEVVDFIDMGITPRLRWPTFNVADIAVTLGVVLLVVEFLWDTRPKKDVSCG
ncbi:MAG: signal peptidase II [Candidatus Eisenbacteria sp.]|nr:signal peptidase II [Candidatus Eisenbacteria bacterium]